MQLVDLAVVFWVMAMWMMMKMSDLADSLLDISRALLVGRSGGGWKGIEVVAYRIGRSG